MEEQSKSRWMMSKNLMMTPLIRIISIFDETKEYLLFQENKVILFILDRTRLNEFYL